MRTSTLRKRVIIVGLVASLFLVIPGLAWLSLTHEPSFYRNLVANVPRAQLEAKAKRFVASSLQLRNDISNERDWQAVFSDQEVNAWLAEDLITHFADQIPPEVHEPRVAFGSDRITLAFQLDRGPIRTVIWVVAQARIPEDNVLSLTFEKIRAGVIPISAEHLIGPITDRAREHGLDVRWTREDDLPVATIRFNPDHGRSDIVLERLSVRQGQIRLIGRSDRLQGAFIVPTLPSRRVLQLNFPRRNTQSRRPSSSSTHRSSTNPTS
jgi:hypothetical protein